MDISTLALVSVTVPLATQGGTAKCGAVFSVCMAGSGKKNAPVSVMSAMGEPSVPPRCTFPFTPVT